MCLSVEGFTTSCRAFLIRVERRDGEVLVARLSVELVATGVITLPRDEMGHAIRYVTGVMCKISYMTPRGIITKDCSYKVGIAWHCHTNSL